jgi:hypothetical protein
MEFISCDAFSFDVTWSTCSVLTFDPIYILFCWYVHSDAFDTFSSFIVLLLLLHFHWYVDTVLLIHCDSFILSILPFYILLFDIIHFCCSDVHSIHFDSSNSATSLYHDTIWCYISLPLSICSHYCCCSHLYCYDLFPTIWCCCLCIHSLPSCSLVLFSDSLFILVRSVHFDVMVEYIPFLISSLFYLPLEVTTCCWSPDVRYIVDTCTHHTAILCYIDAFVTIHSLMMMHLMEGVVLDSAFCFLVFICRDAFIDSYLLFLCSPACSFCCHSSTMDLHCCRDYIPTFWVMGSLDIILLHDYSNPYSDGKYRSDYLVIYLEVSLYICTWYLGSHDRLRAVLVWLPPPLLRGYSLVPSADHCSISSAVHTVSHLLWYVKWVPWTLAR